MKCKAAWREYYVALQSKTFLFYFPLLQFHWDKVQFMLSQPWLYVNWNDEKYTYAIYSRNIQ